MYNIALTTTPKLIYGPTGTGQPGGVMNVTANNGYQAVLAAPEKEVVLQNQGTVPIMLQIGNTYTQDGSGTIATIPCSTTLGYMLAPGATLVGTSLSFGTLVRGPLWACMQSSTGSLFVKVQGVQLAVTA